MPISHSAWTDVGNEGDDSEDYEVTQYTDINDEDYLGPKF